jgi:hypothetical protein
MSKENPHQILVVVAAMATFGVNALANAITLNSQTMGDIYDRFDVFFAPAGYVLVILGLIYLALMAYSVEKAANKTWSVG